MKKVKIAFQGERGAYSHIACVNKFKDVEVKACKTFEETFKTAFEEESYNIIIPIENSIAGRVADIHYLLPKYKLQVYSEYFQKVEHCLIIKQDSKFEDIKYVRSHAQAIGQCQEIINKEFGVIENKFDAKVVTLIWEFDIFYKAEDYHQDYYQKNFLKYLAYKKACQREEVLEKIWN